MTQTLYVGNLPYRTTVDELRNLFEKYGPIHSLIPISDKETAKPRGYCFINLDVSKAAFAIRELSDTVFNGRCLKVGVANGKKRR